MKQEPLQIKMLGGFSLAFEERALDSANHPSKKLWGLLGYLISHRNKEVASSELIDLLWPDGESQNPLNALKALFHRLRSTLNELEFRDGLEMIYNRQGSYGWNNALPCTVDAEEFEKWCKAAERAEPDSREQLHYCLQALQLYRGSFLPDLEDESWVMALQTYYHNLFVKTAKRAIQILWGEGQYEQVVSICTGAITLDPYEEAFHYHLIAALAEMGRNQAALKQYETLQDLLSNRLGVSPSAEVRALYREITARNRGAEQDLQSIKEQLRERSARPCAYYCDYEVFKDLYRFQARAVARTKQVIYLCLIHVTDWNGQPLEQARLDAAMDALGECIRVSLRQSDVFSRYSPSQYILLFPIPAYQNGVQIAERVLGRFRKDHARQAVKLQYNLEPLDPLVNL